MSFKDTPIYKHFLFKVMLIPKLVMSAPYGGWIILLGVLSGFLNFLGIPALIPVLSYIFRKSFEFLRVRA
jgi:hypothetical protein